MVLGHIKDQAGGGVNLRVEGRQQGEGDNRFHEAGREGNLGGREHQGEGESAATSASWMELNGSAMVITTIEPM